LLISLLAPPPGRVTLASSGLEPQQYSDEDLESMGMYGPFLSAKSETHIIST